MRVLVACEESQAVCIEFRKLGHEAYSCDILPCSGGHPEWHIQEDVLEIIHSFRFYTQDRREHFVNDWDMMIAFPPCTYLSYVGMRHWNKPGRSEKREEAMRFFMTLWNTKINKICIENPLGYPSKVFRRPDQVIHPYYFGDMYMKRTCLWLKNLPVLEYRLSNDLFGTRTSTEKPQPLYFLSTTGKAIHFIEGIKGMNKEERQKARSKFWPGIARAMAAQWGKL